MGRQTVPQCAELAKIRGIGRESTAKPTEAHSCFEPITARAHSDIGRIAEEAAGVKAFQQLLRPLLWTVQIETGGHPTCVAPYRQRAGGTPTIIEQELAVAG